MDFNGLGTLKFYLYISQNVNFIYNEQRHQLSADVFLTIMNLTILFPSERLKTIANQNPLSPSEFFYKKYLHPNKVFILVLFI